MAVASAPGKVLLTGAYMLLSRPYAGLTAAVDARFYVKVEGTNDHVADIPARVHVRVLSPQLQRESSYRLSIPDLLLELSAGDEGNPFVEKAVQFAVGAAAALAERRGGSRESIFSRLASEGLEITLLGDNGFYSQRQQLVDSGLPLVSASLASLPPFGPLKKQTSVATAGHASPEVPKTGLGSSAAMAAASVAAVLHHLKVVDLGVDNSQRSGDMEMVHRISQAAHCVAQGKVGSGFDVSSATFGSQRYVRFSPSVLAPALAERAEGNFVEVAAATLNAEWDDEHTPWTLPPGLSLMLGEPGGGGSSTPSMVGAVLKWKKGAGVEGERVWRDLATANENAEEAFMKLNNVATERAGAYRAVLDSCALLPAQEWPQAVLHISDGQVILDSLLALRAALIRARELLRDIGEIARVPIEPEEQSMLLDATMEVEGVVFSGIPGAGGYDAAFAIVIGIEAKKRVENMWASRGVLSLDIKEEVAGIRLENHFPIACSFS